MSNTQRYALRLLAATVLGLLVGCTQPKSQHVIFFNTVSQKWETHWCATDVKVGLQGRESAVSFVEHGAQHFAVADTSTLNIGDQPNYQGKCEDLGGTE